MTLDEVANSDKTIIFTRIGSDRELTLEIQNRLTQVGVLDGPADGQFGPVSIWALSEFLQKVSPASTSLDASAAKALVSPAALEAYPLKPRSDFASRIVAAMLARDYWMCRHPDCSNIVYVDGTNLDGSRNENMHNKFQDLRVIVRVDVNGLPIIAAAWDATAEPGTYYVRTKKLNSRGAAHIVAGQYKAWSVGMHRAGTPSAHEALVQTLPIKISRDHDENFDPTGDAVFTGLFGINQHGGYNFKPEDVRTASAGCLVGRTMGGHREFMKMCKADARYLVNHGYRFVTTVFPQNAIEEI